MCVIIVKRKGQNIPSKSFLRQAAAVNHDGCGFATSSGHYFRSTSFALFWREFEKVAKKDDDIVIHFRWATHGSVAKKNCHPFEGEFTNVYGEKETIWFAHNGVLPIDSVNDMTDSEIAFREYILPTLDVQGRFNTAVREELDALADGYSKFAFVNKNGLHLIGNWIEYRGLLLSNTRFLYSGNMFAVRGITDRFAGVGI